MEELNEKQETVQNEELQPVVEQVAQDNDSNTNVTPEPASEVEPVAETPATTTETAPAKENAPAETAPAAETAPVAENATSEPQQEPEVD